MARSHDYESTRLVQYSRYIFAFSQVSLSLNHLTNLMMKNSKIGERVTNFQGVLMKRGTSDWDRNYDFCCFGSQILFSFEFTEWHPSFFRKLSPKSFKVNKMNSYRYEIIIESVVQIYYFEINFDSPIVKFKRSVEKQPLVGKLRNPYLVS